MSGKTPTGIPVGVSLFSEAGILTMNRNVMMLVIGGLAVAVAVLGYQVYQNREKKGVEISIGNRGISIEKK
jgi:hypothetical protein